jgi:predicted ATP-binding protein involved in virulence
MRIKTIKIEGLFDMFTHTVSLNMKERLSIIYGINGIGKTMLFKILDNLFEYSNHSKITDERRFLTLFDNPFRFLEITYENDQVLKIENQQNRFSISLLEKKRLISVYKLNKNEVIEAIKKEQEYYFATTGDWSTGSLTSKPFNKMDIAIKNILNNTNIYLIETQRLIIFEEIKNGLKKADSVIQYSNEMGYLVQTKRKERDKLSNDLQKNLHKRILTNAVHTNFSIETLRQKSNEVEKRIEQLKQIGLIENTPLDNFEVQDNLSDVQKAILSVNIQDIEATLKIFDDLYLKFQKFVEILNERCFSFKKIMLTENGFVFTNDKGKILTSNELSSGEQHQLVLLYLLLFRISENTLILIDEPEISLHIVWQKAFLEDMKEIINLRPFDILVATHSPAIINGNWDLTIQLKGYGETACQNFGRNA